MSRRLWTFRNHYWKTLQTREQLLNKFENIEAKGEVWKRGRWNISQIFWSSLEIKEQSLNKVENIVAEEENAHHYYRYSFIIFKSIIRILWKFLCKISNKNGVSPCLENVSGHFFCIPRVDKCDSYATWQKSDNIENFNHIILETAKDWWNSSDRL